MPQFVLTSTADRAVLVSEHEKTANGFDRAATLVPDSAEGWEALFWKVFERSRNPMAIIDQERRYVEINPSHAEIFGRPREAIVGTRVDHYLPESELATIQAEYDQFQRDGEFSAERRYVKADGTVVRVQYASCREVVTGHELALFVSHVLEAGDEDENGSTPAERNGEDLSPREREVVHHVAMGMTSRQIAGELTVSTETVRTHIRNALAKTGTRTRAQLVAHVMGTGSLAGER